MIHPEDKPPPEKLPPESVPPEEVCSINSSQKLEIVGEQSYDVSGGCGGSDVGWRRIVLTVKVPFVSIIGYGKQGVLVWPSAS